MYLFYTNNKKIANLLIADTIAPQPRGFIMELEDLSIVSLYHTFDRKFNIKNMHQPPLPEAPLILAILYGLGHDDQLAELNKFAHAKVISRVHYNEVVFYPNIKPEYSARPDVRKFARETIWYLLRDMGFVLDNSYRAVGPQAPICIHVPLNIPGNLRRMRVFGPYMMFDKKYMLNRSILRLKSR